MSLDREPAPQPGESKGPADTATAPADSDAVIRRVDFLATVPLALSQTEAIVAAVHGQTTAAPAAKTTTQDPVEALLTRAFGEQLGGVEIPPDVGFFELGGESLQAMQILARVSEEFGIELDTTLLFTTNFTVEELAEEINDLRDSDASDAPGNPVPLAAATDS